MIPVLTAPEMPTAEALGKDKNLYYIYKTNKDKYKLHREYNNQTVLLLEKLFPGALDGLKTANGYLPTHLPAAEAMEYLQEEARDATSSGECKMRIRDAFGSTGGLKYRPNPHGPREYFNELDNYRRRAKLLGMSPIQPEVVMTSALYTFTHCGHEADKLRSIEEEWRMKEMRFTDSNDEGCYTAFKQFYIRKLKHLYTDRPMKRTKGRANYSHTDDDEENESAGEDTVTGMRRYVDDVLAHNAHLMEVVSAYQGDGNQLAPTDTIEVASVADTAGSTLSKTEYTAYLATLAENKRLTKELAVKTRNTGERRQMNQYCCTHGVNVSHSDKDCKAAGPRHNTRATFKNRMGGSTKNLALWGQWSDGKGNYFNSKHGE